MGWPWGWRRAVVVAGSTSVVVGFLGLIVAVDVLPLGAGRTSVAMLGLLALIPLGFVLMFEGLVTWPADGSPYPWRRRLQGASAGVAALGVVFLVTGLAGQVLPDAWWLDVPVLGLAGLMAYEVFERLRPSHSAVTESSGQA